DLAASVDPVGGGTTEDAGHIDGGEAAAAIEEAMGAAEHIGIGESPYDLAASVDPEGAGGTRGGAGDIDGGEAAAAIDKALVAERIEESPYDLAAIVDAEGGGREGAGDIDGGERVLDIGHGRLHAAENDHSEQEQ